MRPFEKPPPGEGNDQAAKQGAEDTEIVTIVDLGEARKLDEDDAGDDDEPDA